MKALFGALAMASLAAIPLMAAAATAADYPTHASFTPQGDYHGMTGGHAGVTFRPGPQYGSFSVQHTYATQQRPYGGDQGYWNYADNRGFHRDHDRYRRDDHDRGHFYGNIGFYGYDAGYAPYYSSYDAGYYDQPYDDQPYYGQGYYDLGYGDQAYVGGAYADQSYAPVQDYGYDQGYADEGVYYNADGYQGPQAQTAAPCGRWMWSGLQDRWVWTDCDCPTGYQDDERW